MRICFLADATSVHTQRWVRYFVSRGHDVHVITHLGKIPGVKLHKLITIKGVSFVTGPIQTRDVIKEIKPDIVHAHWVVNYGFYGAVSGFHPFIITPWGSDIATAPEMYGGILRPLIEYALMNADLVHVQDPLGRERVKQLGAEEEKVKVIPWGVDLTSFSPEASSKKWRAKLRKNPGPVVIFLRGIEKRFTSTLIEAMRVVRNEIPTVNFLIVGSKEIKDMNSKNVCLIDRFPYNFVPFYLANSDVFVDPYYPKHRDGIGHGYGMALLEAMACGTPTIAASRPTISELKNRDRWYFGYTFKGNSSDDLAKKIFRLLKNEGEGKKISKLNRRIIGEKFDFNKNMREIEKIYQNLRGFK